MSLIKFIFSKAFVKQLIIAGVVLLLLVFLILYWLKFTTNHNIRIEVPDLAKMSLDNAVNKLKENDLRLEVLDSANFNPEYPKYSVIEQIPTAGSMVKENRKIYITLNPSGYRKVEIPPLAGRTKRQVEPTLRALGFEIGQIIYRPDMAKDRVLEMRHKGKEILPGDILQITSVIDLVLGDGKQSYQGDNEEGEEVESEGEQITDDNTE
ncbi:MAG: PASTA domain-containing protein [Flavobacteriaceae bacterium]